MNPLGNQGARKRGNDAFYGQDSGTALNGGTQEDLEKDAYAQGHKGNSVDISQQYAPSEADDYTEQAERMTRDMERGAFKHSGQFADPEKRRDFVEQLAEQLRGKPARPAQPQEEDGEAAGIGSIRLYDKKGHDEFWNNPEELKRVGKLVRPKL
jgi:hypothetical protein